jgi:hypothetical protein
VLFRLPKPVLFDVFLFAISSGKDFLKLSLICKRVKDFIQKDSRPWLSILILNFPKLLGNDLESLKIRLLDGYIDSSKDWKSMYIKEYVASVQKLHETSIKKLVSFCKPITAHKFFEAMKKANFKFSLKKGRQIKKVNLKNITFLDQSLIIKVDLDTPNENIGNLVLNLYGKTTEFEARNKTLMKEGKIKLLSNENGLEIILADDSYTQYWILSYSEIYKRITSYSLSKIFNGNNRNLGLINYNLQLDLTSINSTLASHSVRVFDLTQEVSIGRALIEDLKIRIPKEKLVLEWKTLAFSEKIDNVACLSFTIFDEQGRLFLWGSSAVALVFVESNGNEGDGFSFTVRNENCSVACFLRDKGKSFMMVSILVEINLEYARKYIY